MAGWVCSVAGGGSSAVLHPLVVVAVKHRLEEERPDLVLLAVLLLHRVVALIPPHLAEGAGPDGGGVGGCSNTPSSGKTTGPDGGGVGGCSKTRSCSTFASQSVNLLSLSVRHVWQYFARGLNVPVAPSLI